MAVAFPACCSALLLNATRFSIYRFTDSIFGVNKEYKHMYQRLFSRHPIVALLAK